MIVTGTTLATCWALFLPPVKKSIYFHRPDEAESLHSEIDGDRKNSGASFSSGGTCKKSKFFQKFKRAYVYLLRDFVGAYTNWHVVKWSFWWAFATCGFLQVFSYIQPLWQTAVESDTEIYNGAVEAAYTIIGKQISFPRSFLTLLFSFD